MIPQTFYHIYNRGNNKQNIFFCRDNYLYFLKKVKRHLLPYINVVAYCLMPNHFHFLVYTKESIEHKEFSNDFRIMLSSYTRAINKQEKRVGSLFQQHSKIKALDSDCINGTTTQSGSTTGITDANYPFICFHYIHQNPVKAGLVEQMQDWEMSSCREYAGLREDTLCHKQTAYKLLEIPKKPDLFLIQARAVILD